MLIFMSIGHEPPLQVQACVSSRTNLHMNEKQKKQTSVNHVSRCTDIIVPTIPSAVTLVNVYIDLLVTELI